MYEFPTNQIYLKAHDLIEEIQIERKDLLYIEMDIIKNLPFIVKLFLSPWKHIRTDKQIFDYLMGLPDKERTWEIHREDEFNVLQNILYICENSKEEYILLDDYQVQIIKRSVVNFNDFQNQS